MRIAVFIGITALFLPGHVIGEEVDFIPRLVNTDGALELDMRRIDTRRTTSFGDYDTTLFSSIERLRLAADGYVYHPRLMIFRISGAAGLDQGYYKTSGYYSQTAHHVFDEYDINTTLLPEHPYNLELFARRVIEPLSPTYPQSTLAASRGAIFRYRQRPFALLLSAVDQSLETGESTFDSKLFSAGGSYLIGPVSNAVTYGHGDSLSSQGTQAVRTTASFNNGISLDVASLNSNIGKDQQNQTNPATGSIKTDSSSWSERLHTDLPFNVSADVQHEYHKDEITTEEPSPAVESTAFNKTTTDTVTLSHMLYRSLRTTFSAFQSSSQATGGDTKSSQELVAVSYLKNIPIGALNADYSFQDMSFTRTGTAAITNEKHTTVVPGTFTLLNPSADPSTVTVLVTDPATQNLVTLTSNVNYQVLQFGTVLQITILSLPDSIIFAPGAAYDFRVTYFLMSIDSKTEVRTNAFHLGFTLFNGLVSPFAGYSTTDVNSSVGGIPNNDTVRTTTYGCAANMPPFTAYAEFTDYRSRLNPRQSMDTWAEYRELLTVDTDVLARLSYNETSRPGTELSPEYSEKITTLNVSAHTALPHEHLSLFVGGSYSDRRITGISSVTYSLQPGLQWHVGMLDVNASASRTYTVSFVSSGKQFYEQDTYYLTVSRKLF